MLQHSFFRKPRRTFRCNFNDVRDGNFYIPCKLCKRLYRLFAHGKKLLLPDFLPWIFPISEGNCDDHFFCLLHQLCDDPVLYRRKARKPVEYNHAVLQQLRLRHIRRQHLQRFLRRQIFFPDELLKALVNCPQIF